MTTAFPDADGFERAAPAGVGLDPARVEGAATYAREHGSPVARDFSDHRERLAVEEHGEIVGPLPDERGDPNGLVLRDGRVVAEWGPTDEVQLCFSVTKSFLSGVAGVAFDRGLIDLHEPVAETVDDGGFDGEHNGRITWHHLLTQTSEWKGELFGKPDAVDRNRPVARDAEELGARGDRELREPGTYWEYNDVRINRLALALLRRFEHGLPAVLDDAILSPIGATSDWAWHGYETSWVDVDGERIQSVSGGGHWGGGLWISARDLARYGLLMLNEGEWDGEQLLSTEWVDRALTPCDVEPTYGYLWWLNTDGGLWPSAPDDSYAALGYGANVVWVDPEHDLVAVVRWLDWDDDRAVQDGFLERLLAAVER
jgi:CubicO group peptidase (beta-lactamase class C family)